MHAQEKDHSFYHNQHHLGRFKHTFTVLDRARAHLESLKNLKDKGRIPAKVTDQNSAYGNN